MIPFVFVSGKGKTTETENRSVVRRGRDRGSWLKGDNSWRFSDMDS